MKVWKRINALYVYYYTSAGLRGLGSVQGNLGIALHFPFFYFVPIRLDFPRVLIGSPTRNGTQLMQRSRLPHMQSFCPGGWLE